MFPKNCKAAHLATGLFTTNLILSAPLALAILTTPAISVAVETSSGPRSQEEAELLWEQGQDAFNRGRYNDAVRDLERLVARYPGAQGYLEAHLMLGESLMKIGKPARAITPLRYVTQAGRSERDLSRARLLLARAYMESEKYRESYLATLEIEKKHGSSETIQSEALVIRARALTGLREDAQAAKVLDSAKALTGELQGEAAWLRLQLKTRECARFPTHAPLDEEKTRDQMQRRGSCLNEALLAFRSAVRTTEVPWMQKSLDAMKSAYDSYWKACLNPPAPPEPPAGSKAPRTAQQLKRYREELAAFLRSTCTKNLEEQSGLITAWQPQLPEAGGRIMGALNSHLTELTGPTPGKPAAGAAGGTKK